MIVLKDPTNYMSHHNDKACCSTARKEKKRSYNLNFPEVNDKSKYKLANRLLNLISPYQRSFELCFVFLSTVLYWLTGAERSLFFVVVSQI